MSSKLSNIKTELSKICSPQKPSFLSRAQKYNSIQIPAQKFVDDKILNYQYQQSKKQLDLYKNQPSILKPTMISSPPPESVNFQKNSIMMSTTDQNSIERMKFLVSRIERLEKENSELHEKSLYHDKMINNLQPRSQFIAPKFNHSVIYQPKEMSRLQEQAEQILQHTSKLEDNNSSQMENYEKSKLLKTINKIKDNLTKSDYQQQDIYRIQPQQLRSTHFQSPPKSSYYYREKKKKSYCQNCAYLLSKGIPTTQCLHR